jgi:iron(III) transport system substrate-binding protein
MARRRVILGMLLSLLMLGCTAPRSAPPAQAPVEGPPATAGSETLQALVEGARKEGQLTLVWGEGILGGTTGARHLADGFNRAYGLSVNTQFTPGPSMPQMASQVAQEYQAGRRATTDVFVGYDNHISLLAQANALEPVNWVGWAPNIRQPEMVAPDGVAVTFETSVPGITYNTIRVGPDLAPTALQDLLKPEFKGRIGSTPYAANFDRVASDEMWGEQRTMEYMTRLSDQIASLVRCNELERLLSAEFDVFAIDCNQSWALSMKAKGAPVNFVIPADAPMLLYFYLAVPSSAAHPNAAKLWINYVLSREAQDYLYETEFQDSHLVSGSKTARALESLQATNARFLISNVEFVQRNGADELLRRSGKAQEILRRQ